MVGSPYVGGDIVSPYLLVLLSKHTEPMMRMLWAHIKEAGISKEDCQTIFLLGDEQPEGAKDTPTEIQLSRTLQQFRCEMEQSDPRCIIPIGPECFRAVTGLKWSIDEARGYVIPPDYCKPTTASKMVEEGVYKSGPKKGTPKTIRRRFPLPPPLPTTWAGNPGAIVPSISLKHYVMGKRRQVTAVMSAFQNAAAFVAGQPLEPENFLWEDHFKKPWDPWMIIHEDRLPMNVAFDIEVPIGSKAIERISLSSDNPSATFSMGWCNATKEFLQTALRSPGFHVAHNAQFDIPILEANGVIVPEPYWDTMIGASLLEPDMPKGLAATAPIYVLTTPWKWIGEEPGRGYTDPYYSAKDAYIERRVFEEQRVALEEWGMTELFTKRIMPSVKALIDLKEKGLKVDPVEAEKWCRIWQDQLTDLFHWWDGHFPGVNAASPAELKTLFYKTWGLPVQRSKHDGWTTDELAIRTLMEIAPQYAEAFTKLLQIRGTGKLLSTYGKAVLGVGTVHPSYLPRGKDEKKGEREKNKGLPGTGRLACSGPNIQNQPDESRCMYVPDEPGWVFVGADYNQAELRVMAVRSKDGALLEALGGDVHAATMALVGCDRTLAKNGLYGTSYGAGPKRLVDMLRENGVYTTQGAMKDFQTSLARAYPRWWAYLQAIGQTGLAQGYLRNPFGRVRRFTNGGGDVPAMKDYEPQSTVGDIGWSTYRQLWEGAASVGGRLGILVHDEIVTMCEPSRVPQMKEMLRDVMGQEFPQVAPGFRLPISLKVGPRWGIAMQKEE